MHYGTVSMMLLTQLYGEMRQLKLVTFCPHVLKMGTIEENDNDIFMEDASFEVLDLNPKIGHEYQAEIPSMIKKSEELSLRMNPSDSEAMHGRSLSFAIGLPIPVTWIHNEMEDSGHGDINSCQLSPGILSSSWSEADTKSFLLGLFIFGKNFIQIKRFFRQQRDGGNTFILLWKVLRNGWIS